MSNLISTFYTENSRGRVEVHYESSGVLTHKFYSQEDLLMFTDTLTTKSVTEAEELAEDWVLGIKEIPC